MMRTSIRSNHATRRTGLPGKARTLTQWCLVALIIGAISGCLFPTPIVPLDSIVYVPHPHEVGDKLSGEELKELYSASPNRNPDGLGVLDSIWLQSQMTLTIWEIEKDAKERNRIAYARTPAEHNAIMQESEFFYRNFVVFKGVLIGTHADLVEPEWYAPEGVYLIDDRGRKFKPVRITRGYKYYWLERNFDPNPSGGLTERKREVYFGYPFLSFPGEAISRETKAITLFLASPEKRMSFTWVFDPDYTPTIATPWQGSPGSSDRLWPKRQ